MGNEKSAPSGLEIDEKSVEITDFWIHYTAHINDYNAEKVSVFISEPSLHYNANFGNPSPLEKAAKVNVNFLIIPYKIGLQTYMYELIRALHRIFIILF